MQPQTKQKPDWIQFQTTLRCTIKDGERVVGVSETQIDSPPIRIVGVIECEDGPLLFIERGPLIVKGNLLKNR